MYVVLGRIALHRTSQRFRLPAFAFVNILALTVLTLLTRYDEWLPNTIVSLGTSAVLRHIVLIGGYVGLITIGYLLLRRFAMSSGALPWIAFSFPILLLIVFRYFGFLWQPIFGRIGWPEWALTATIVGISYMAFRLSYLVLEVRNGVAKMPGPSEYLGFAFFLPTIVIGPISPFSLHQNSLNVSSNTLGQVPPSLIRICVGATKFFFLANLANQLTYNGIFLDGKPHSLFDLFVAAIFYYLYLFCNFSGFCDMAIGLAALIGIRVKENFDNPFAARNIKEFWNRWHITLSEFVRDVVFTPVSKGLTSRLGPKYVSVSISVAAVATFLVIGVWHGLALNYIIFGLIHAVGIIVNQYYTIWMKAKLGPSRYKIYNQNRLVNAIATVSTFMYVTIAFAFFANSTEMLSTILVSVSASW